MIGRVLDGLDQDEDRQTSVAKKAYRYGHVSSVTTVPG
jgi:hypothetical protein